jgi:A118 family predicted phage portal protein
MDITSVIDYLQKQRGYTISSSYYTYIAEWEDWWKGYHKPFHQFKERQGDKLIEREMYTLKMAKKVCEDWASILLNEKTEICIDDKKSEDFVIDVIDKSNFLYQANGLIEKAFYSGTGAIVMRFDNMLVKGESILKDKQTRIRFEFLPANYIIPLTVVGNDVKEVAFASDVTYKGKKYTYLETHILETMQEGSHEYVITNKYFEESNGTLEPAALPNGLIEQFRTGSDIPLFAIIRPSIIKTIQEGAGMGQSIFADAIDILKGVDLAYNNFCRDFKLGGKKVFYNNNLIRFDDMGNAITPDDVAQQLFLQIGDGNGLNDNCKPIVEYNPTIRVAENKDGIQAMLDYLSFKVGFGTKHYQFNAGSIVTATQYTGDKQELVQNASKHYMGIKSALTAVVRAILWAGQTIIGEAVKPHAEIDIKFDDGYIIDKESERERDRQDARDGFMQKWEYRVKWYGETEEEAKAAIAQSSEGIADPFGFASASAPAGAQSTQGAVDGSGNETKPEVQGKALNGAQTQSLIAIMAQLSAGAITEGQAVNLISTAIGIGKEEAKKLLSGEM